MKLLKTNSSYLSQSQKHDRYVPKISRKNSSKNDFRKLLEGLMIEEKEEQEEFNVLLPKHGHFWDNGYEDVG